VKEPFVLTIEGNKSVPSRVLRRQVALDLNDYAESGFEPAYIDDAAFSVEQYYLSIGNAFAQVTYEIDAEHNVHITVEEGPRTRLSQVQATGLGVAPELTSKDLATFFHGPRTGWMGTGDPVYVASRVKNAPGRIESEYVARGFLDARIDVPEIEFDAERANASIRIKVHEGRRYRVADVIALGDTATVLDNWDALYARFGPGQGKRTFTPRLEHELRSAVLQHANKAGYVNAWVDVTLNVDRAKAEVAISIMLDAGEQVTLSDILFQGAPDTRDAFLRSRLRIKVGELANAQRIRESLERLYRTGLFTSVDANLEGEGAERDLVFDLEERESLEVFIEPGWGSYELLRVRTGIRERNLLGTGRQLRIEALAAVRTIRGVIGLTDPFTFGDELIGDLTLDFERRQEPSFESQKAGIGAFLTHEWDTAGRVATSFGYQFRDTRSRAVEITNGTVPLIADGGGEFGSDVDLSSLKVSHIIDKRDSPLMSRTGYLAKLSLEFGDESLGSELEYSRVDLGLTRSFTVREDDVIAVAFRSGVIDPTRGQVVPLQERYFNGGENTVRSFQYDDLGPMDANGQPIGGEAYSVFNLEWRHDLTGTGVHGALFGDLGNVTVNSAEYWDFRDVRGAIGVGLRYMLPVGPLRVDVAFNPDRRHGEDEWVVHFSVGLPF
jgi:outer membrane protein insertion porin family